MKRYEGMFLFDNAVTREWAAIEQEVQRLCGRIAAELLVCVKFDERKLAYEIRRRKRGTYVLTYFEAPPERIADLERDARLSESVLRLLVLRADHVPEEKINELKTWPAETPLQALSGDGRRHGDYDQPERGHRASRAAERGRAERLAAADESKSEPSRQPPEETEPTGESTAAPPAGDVGERPGAELPLE